MKADTKSELRGLAKTTSVIAAGAAVVGLVTWQAMPPDSPTITLAWDCQSYQDQTFQIIRRTNLTTAPWEFVVNAVGTNRVTVPRLHPEEYFTIGATWMTADTNQVLRWEGRQ